jgi:ATP-dependent Clp protease ATP-binding subunit ClpA
MNAPAAGQTRLVIVGATGMVGGYALRYALDHPSVRVVTVIGRRKLGISHSKLTEAFHRDFAGCSSLAEALSDQDAAVFCLASIPAPCRTRISARSPQFEAPEGEIKMARLSLLDRTKTGRKAQDLESKLRRLVIGQEEAIHEIVRTYQTHVAGLSPAGRPIGNFLFLGPTGSGKTRIVEATAQSLLNNPRAVVKIDCAEFQHSHEIAKLIGSPPGYLGHRETHALLSQEALNQHHTEKMKLSFVLFDEIEKASDALWNLLLGILDKGILTLGDNRKVDFSSAMVFLTSNLGAGEMCSLSGPRLGFHSPQLEDAGFHEELGARMSRVGVAAARRKFTPEFINRLDKIVVFRPLGQQELRRIVDIELDMVQERIQNAVADKSFMMNVTDSAREFLLMEGTDSRYGARHLKRAIERLVVQPLSNLIASGQVRRGDCLRVSRREGSSSLTFFQEAEALQGWKVARRVAA